MTRKYLSLVTATGILYVYLLSQLRSGDALFLVTSDSLLMNIVLVALAAFAVYVSFMDKFKSVRLYVATLVAAIALSALGFLGLIYTSLDNYFAAAIKPLDYVIFLQLGIIFSICSLSYAHQPLNVRLPAKLKVPNLALPRPVANFRQQMVKFIESDPANTGRTPRASSV